MKCTVWALVWGLITPVWFTVKAFYIRKFEGKYKSWDIGIDAILFESIFYCILLVVYLNMDTV